MFVDDKLDAAAGVRQPLEAYAKDHPDMRVMSGAFQEITQAMGMPKRGAEAGKAGAAYLEAFVEEMKASGFVADALKRSGQVAQVAPPAKAASCCNRTRWTCVVLPGQGYPGRYAMRIAVVSAAILVRASV